MTPRVNRRLLCEDGFPVRGTYCEDCPQRDMDREEEGRRYISDWFTAKPKGAEPRFHCHAEGSPYHPATDEDRGCRGFYAAAARMGFRPGQREPAP